MNIVIAYPPNIAEIRTRFRLPPGAGIIFAYGDTIYNPDGISISPFLLAHEQTHQRQQGCDPAGWWHRYLADLPWRLDQELEAHRVEYRATRGRLRCEDDTDARTVPARNCTHGAARDRKGRRSP